MFDNCTRGDNEQGARQTSLAQALPGKIPNIKAIHDT